jgi:four helix bundle protein
MAKGDDIQNRLMDFAVNILSLCSTLPKTAAGRHISGQLLRSGTSPAPNYGEARGAESKKDFVHKLGIVFKEINESNIWLEMIKRSGMLNSKKLVDVYKEGNELAKIVAASIRTAGKKR